MTAKPRVWVSRPTWPDIVARLALDGATPVGNTPQQFTEQIKAEFEVYKKVVKDRNLKLD